MARASTRGVRASSRSKQRRRKSLLPNRIAPPADADARPPAPCAPARAWRSRERRSRARDDLRAIGRGRRVNGIKIALSDVLLVVITVFVVLAYFKGWG